MFLKKKFMRMKEINQEFYVENNLKFIVYVTDMLQTCYEYVTDMLNLFQHFLLQND